MSQGRCWLRRASVMLEEQSNLSIIRARQVPLVTTRLSGTRLPQLVISVLHGLRRRQDKDAPRIGLVRQRLDTWGQVELRPAVSRLILGEHPTRSGRGPGDFHLATG